MFDRLGRLFKHANSCSVSDDKASGLIGGNSTQPGFQV
jgi:hypothetical protein